MSTAATPYVKHHSFSSFHSRIGADPVAQAARALTALTVRAGQYPAWQAVLERAALDLAGPDNADFRLTPFIADEMSLLADADLPRYLYHRYRYDVFPHTRELDEYPPYIQIEPSSVCNFRCVFCYQTDGFFASRKSGMMGKMSFEMFREIVDQIEGKIDFGSLASRGEPLINVELPRMLAYCRGKFLGLKVNTNASLLTEEAAHALLCGGLRTIVFSADAAAEPTYSQLRVNGSLDETVRNISRFQQIRERDYPDLPVITRVSGVRFDERRQGMQEMVDFWADLVDQVSFVRYNPWENIYESAPTNVEQPCSDLWRRLFVWFDGKTNPCDTDYRSILSPGALTDSTVSEIWRSAAYEELRQQHSAGRRSKVEPCRRCTVV